MTVYSWPWLLTAILVSLLFVAALGFVLAKCCDEETWYVILGVVAFAATVLIISGALFLIGSGFSYAFTGHA